MLLPILFASFAVLLVGCEDEAGVGALELYWKIGTLSCEEAALSEVSASVYAYDPGSPKREERSPCLNADSERFFRLGELEPGDYTLFLRGADGDGCTTHEIRRDVTVWEGRSRNLGSIALLRKRRGLSVQWSFEGVATEDAVSAFCDDNGVAQMEVRITVADLYDERFLSLCEPGYTEIGETLPAGQLEITLRALDRDGTALAKGVSLWEGDVFTSSPCEPLIPLDVDLALCERPNCESF